MFKAALAFVPLLAGYIFVTTWYQTSFLIKREDSQKVYFRAAFWGLWLFMLAFAALSWLRPTLDPLLSFFGTWREQEILTDGAPATHIELMFWVITLASTLVLGMVGGYLLNWLFAFWSIPKQELLRLAVRLVKGRDVNFISSIYSFSKLAAVRRAIHAMNSDLDILLLRALEESMPVSISLGSGKVYVGYVTGSIDPGEKREMLRILPLVSGYRAGESMKLEFTTWYSAIYQQFSRDNTLSHLRPELFEVILPLGEVKSMSLFDIDAYRAFQAEAPA
ncbi:hypothetical protein GXB82_05530 [Pseudomonas stutzeri]|uniref:hypothetical protein n=1 Tax=Stutzerimonas frequens TaxID=2968969 RepID=UPI0007B8D414|nr:hypothetical protein [Stutzerimonas frequens]KZX63969.1 hypothetical protein A3710_14595 [Stutzerimonas frequens]NCT78278.1 hypothetical protein [Stutzerimonas stutzeri]